MANYNDSTSLRFLEGQEKNMTFSVAILRKIQEIFVVANFSRVSFIQYFAY